MGDSPMFRKFMIILMPLILVLVTVPGHATMVRKMDLEEMCQLAGRIFRGTVVDIEKGTVSAGGGKISTITYRIKIAEQLKGVFADAINGDSILSISTVDLPVIEVPRLAVGQHYLLLTTAPSSAGLSTMVGLGQGTFKIYGGSNAEMAVNALNNIGLAKGLTGPVPYQDIADRIRGALRKEGPRK